MGLRLTCENVCTLSCLSARSSSRGDLLGDRPTLVPVASLRPAAPCVLTVTVLPQVSAYGFITSNYQQYSDHYFEREKKPVIFYANHDLTLEAALWRSLHNAGILRLYQR